MHSKDLLDVIFLLGSFQGKKKSREYMRDKRLVLLIQTLDKKRSTELTVHMNSVTNAQNLTTPIL